MTLREIRAEWVAKLHNAKGAKRRDLLRHIQKLTVHIRLEERGSLFHFFIHKRGAQSLSARADKPRLVE